ncbi:hypothetical protein [Thiomicrospira sp. ALE5]|uniref:hypothetical protein n=1 Tax=Thiomicrospira sp. ALE5 TaxID=748650 RepID=UPI0008ED2C7F|nr:hypothetical protein [Thiomicrospira sp. ALE5]SFR50800.1 hypothetical protein SAMN03092900_0415 [Thiomicrospira sp. ALE5]
MEEMTLDQLVEKLLPYYKKEKGRVAQLKRQISNLKQKDGFIHSQGLTKIITKPSDVALLMESYLPDTPEWLGNFIHGYFKGRIKLSGGQNSVQPWNKETDVLGLYLRLCQFDYKKKEIYESLAKRLGAWPGFGQDEHNVDLSKGAEAVRKHINSMKNKEKL